MQEDALGELSSVENIVKINGVQIKTSRILAKTTFDHVNGDVGSDAPIAGVPQGQEAEHREPERQIHLQPEKRYLCAGDVIKTEKNSRAGIALYGLNSLIRLDENTEFLINTREHSSYARTRPEINLRDVVLNDASALGYCLETINRTWLHLKEGALRLFTDQPRKLNVNTPFLNASIEGTEFSVRVDKDRTSVAVTSGVVSVCNGIGEPLVLMENQQAVAQVGKAPQLVDPEDAVQWALYYPTIGDIDNQSASIQMALERLRTGRVKSALELLADDSNVVHLALRSAIAITQNNLDEAVELSQKALDRDASSASAWLAASLVAQAEFQLDLALRHAQTALELSSDDVYVLTRVAELLLVKGDTTEAEKLAYRAVALWPDLARVHSVLGYVQLRRLDFNKAENSFVRAIAADESDPWPRLGLGLTLWRLNRAASARRHIEMAVNLNPAQSLLRSYLGKAYLALGLDSQALEQFAIAEKLDAKDPTVNLYRASLFHGINRLPDALRDLTMALSKNDFRAVYRSRASLDEDFGIKLASTARVYDELGFHQLALFESTRSVEADPANYAGHRMLADTFRQRPRHLLASASQQLQFQLRQPLNSNPTHIQLADSSLNAFRDTGPFSTSFNEYSRMFSQNGFTTRAAFQTGGNDTRSRELQVSSLYSRVSAALTGYHYTTDGIRDESRKEEQHLTSFLQSQVSDRLGVQLEYLNSEYKTADDFIGFDRMGTVSLTNYSYQHNRWRLGVRGEHSPSNLFLFHAEIQESEEKLLDLQTAGEQEMVIDSHYLEFQNILGFATFNTVSGLSIGDEREARIRRFFSASSISEMDRLSRSAYVYAYPSYSFGDENELDLTLGVDYTRLISATGVDTYINPKLGLSITLDQVTLRAAAFRALTRSQASFRSLEPTHIVGFVQNREDFNDTDSRNFGVGLDTSLKFDRDGEFNEIHIGADHLLRRYRYHDVAGLSESFSSAYAYYAGKAFSMGLTLRTEGYSTNETEQRSKFYFVDARTNRIDLDVGLFLPHSLSIKINPMYILQRGLFNNPVSGDHYSGSDRFALINLGIHKKYSVGGSRRLSGSWSLSIDNLLDKQFNFQDTDPFRPSVAYERTVAFKLQLSVQ